MRCEEADRLIPDYSTGNLSRRAQRRVREHLGRCPSCAMELERLKRVMAAVEADLQPVEPPAGLWNGVYNRITAARKPGRKGLLDGLLITPRRALSLAAAAAVVAGAVIFGVSTHPPRPESAARAPEPATVEYIQDHASAAAYDAFADRVGLSFVASMPASERRKPL